MRKEITLPYVLLVNESPRMIRSVRDVLKKDGFIVNILTSSHLPNTAQFQKVDALESIRAVRNLTTHPPEIYLVAQEY
ncbi:MAG: hypothetical protein AAGC85_03345 [Bacteroidota bacterium]